jgi:phosphatidylglycerophosphate synthase
MLLTKQYEKFIKDSYTWRSRYFSPLLKILADFKITPNQITIFRLIFVLPLAYFFYYNNLFAAAIFYIIFWVLDLFDGALARFLNIQSDKGRFLDTIVDNSMYAFMILGFIYLNAAAPLLLAYNILAEISVQVLAAIKNAKKQESDWLIKIQTNIPYFKTISHAILIFYMFGLNLLNPGFLLINIGITLTTAYFYFLIIKKV